MQDEEESWDSESLRWIHEARREMLREEEGRDPKEVMDERSARMRRFCEENGLQYLDRRRRRRERPESGEGD